MVKQSFHSVRSCLSVFALLIITSALAQENKDYVIKLNNDTIFTKVLRIHKNREGITCEEKGKKISYEAENIKGFTCDTVFYETALVRLKKRRAKKYCFLRRTIKGKMSLYEISIKRSEFLWGNFAEDIIRLRWAYKAQAWRKKTYANDYFYKKENETREQISRVWQEKVKDCKLLTDKLSSKTLPWTPSPFELVRFYNDTCD